MNKAQAEALLRKAVGDPRIQFRDGQWEAIDGLVNQRKKLLVVQRTGWGKSSVYFISTRILRNQGYGPTIIVSPLLALMRNQIAAAERLGLRAVTMNSTNMSDWPGITEALNRNTIDALLISPERLNKEDFEQTVLLPNVDQLGLLVVDEAHCISDWGHDFRRDYQRIINVLQQIPTGTPLLATTATANNRVVEDIRHQLGDVAIQRGPLARKSLRLQALRLPDQAARLAWLAKQIPSLPGSGIVYTLTKHDADQVTRWLQQNDISAWHYYGDASHPDFVDSNAYREALEHALLANEIKVVVATSALGMGFDKPDLGFVIHYQAPGNLVAYYQQVGRAGRAISEARGVLLSGREDDDIHEYFWRSAFPDEHHIQELLELLENSDGLKVGQIQKHLNLRKSQITQLLDFLKVETPAPIFQNDSLWYRTPSTFTLNRERINFLTQRKAREWQEVQHYLDTDDCLMEFLQKALDDPDPKPCGHCANCDPGGASLESTFPKASGIAAVNFLRRGEQPIAPRKKLPSGKALPRYDLPYQLNQKALAAETGRYLSRWGDAGWGKQISQNKRAGRFGDELVEAIAEMISQRWQPEPTPQWLTWVPSLRHPDLVLDFAVRLANRLGLPHAGVVSKTHQNQPQKSMQNSYHQCQNLDGVFQIQGRVDPGPVLLVDDVVDSGWTFTVVTALLRRAGSGPVFPVALASTTTE